MENIVHPVTVFLCAISRFFFLQEFEQGVKTVRLSTTCAIFSTKIKWTNSYTLPTNRFCSDLRVWNHLVHTKLNSSSTQMASPLSSDNRSKYRVKPTQAGKLKQLFAMAFSSSCKWGFPGLYFLPGLTMINTFLYRVRIWALLWDDCAFHLYRPFLHRELFSFFYKTW